MGGLAAFFLTQGESYGRDKMMGAVERRLKLWSTFSEKNTSNMVCRYQLKRQSSLLSQDIVRSGTLVYQHPSELLLRDDGREGSMTSIAIDALSIRSHTGEIKLQANPNDNSLSNQKALCWLKDHLLALFTPPPRINDRFTLADLRHNWQSQAVLHVPKSRSPQLELSPPANSDIRRKLQSINIRMDPVGGAILGITILETQGDRIFLKLSDHRQNIAKNEVKKILSF